MNDRYAYGKKKRALHHLVIREMQTRIPMKEFYTPTKMAKIQDWKH